MIDIAKAFMLGLVSGEQVDLKDLLPRVSPMNNAMFSINEPSHEIHLNSEQKSTKAYLSRQQHIIKTDFENIKINGSWLLELID